MSDNSTISYDHKSVNNIPEYIDLVNEIVTDYPDEVVVFRGENKQYPTACRPFIFRDKILGENKFFEKNLFDSMRQNKLSSEISYLNNAIDAQHGSFPSRLLDVSYNCLAALYFAVTPYRQDEEKNDDKDGVVFVIHFDRVYSPSSAIVQKDFEKIITHEDPLLSDNMLFSKNHKLIDHCKINNRIIAQQGAFILFRGDDVEPLPQYLYKAIKIPGRAKKQIRQQLNQLFGIHTGSIYPEIDNIAKDLSKKSKRIESRSITFASELEDIEYQLESEIEYYYDRILEAHRDDVEVCRITEKVLYSYYLGVIQLKEFLANYEDETGETQETFKCFLEKYNSIMQDFQKEIEKTTNHISPKSFIFQISEPVPTCEVKPNVSKGQ